MNAAQRHRQTALVKATGFEDGPALTQQSTDGEIPHGRELSFAWLAGTVMTGLTSVLLMGAALYVSFLGQDTFSTAYDALQIERSAPAARSVAGVRTDRMKPITYTRSEREIIEASIRDTVNGVARIKKQPFVRIRATLATAGTALSADIPVFDPVALLNRNQPIEAPEPSTSTAIYGAEVEGEVTVRTAAINFREAPRATLSDQAAAEYVRLTVEGAYSEAEITALGYAAESQSVRELGTSNAILGVAENVTVVPKSLITDAANLGRTERIVTIKADTELNAALRKNGFTAPMTTAIERTVRSFTANGLLRTGSRLRILFGPEGNTDTLIPYRLTIYQPGRSTVTAALSDRGGYVMGENPPDISFKDDDTEEISVAALPTIYRAIWETGRKHDLDDATIERIVAMFAYDVELDKRIAPGDAIDILQTAPDAAGEQQLLYVGLTLNKSLRERFRFRTEDGVVDFFDAEGQTGKRFLTRRPLKGGGTLRSRFGYRIHPIFKTRKLHNGVDLAAPTGTPIYAAGDGVIKRAQWVSGYGRMVEINHVNGYETGYGHMSRIADGMVPGKRVRQGEIIGYVGSTGYSTGPHLHFEVQINGRFVDPLSVKLPRDKTLPARYSREFAQTVTQIEDLMKRDAKPVTVAAVN